MQDFMIELLLCSVTMSALALFYMAITPFLAKRYSVTGRYYTWLILVIGLIIPFRPQFDNAIIRVHVPERAAAPVVRMGNGMPAGAGAEPVLPPAFAEIPWWRIAAAVWLAGMLVFLAYHAVKHCRFLKLAARWSKNIRDEQTLALFQNLKTQMGLIGEIGLQLCDSIGSPMMIGFAKPRILLPNADFAKDELCFILKHELVHHKRKDLWYKSLVLLATAIHWFNPIVYLLAKVIDIQCELSCDKEVVRSADADTRQYYSETIIGVVRYQSKRKTALSTHFYGGKKGMKKRIFSIMDRSNKKVGVSVLCGALVLTLGTGVAFAADAKTQNPPRITKDATMVTPQLPIAFLPDPDTYAPYVSFGVTISEDGAKLLYEGQPVRLFVDEKSDTEAFYLDGAGNVNLAVARNAAGEITGVESITGQEAQQYQDAFFADESIEPYIANAEHGVNAQDNVIAKDSDRIGENKYDRYQSFGVTYSATDEELYFNGQKVKLLVDQETDGWFGTFWTDDTGTVNLAVLRDASGRITDVESISDERAQEYRSASDEYEQNALDRLEERVTERINKRYSEE